MEDILNQKFTNSKGHEFTVIEYIGRDSKKQHVYTVKFTETGNEYQYRRTHCRKATARDLQREKIEKRKAKEKKKYSNTRMSKEPDEFPNMEKGGLLTVDQSSTCAGWCFVGPDKSFITGEITPNPGDNFTERCFMVALEVNKLIDKHKPDFVAFESIYMSANASVAMKLGALLGMLELVCMTYKTPFAVVESMRWKNHFNITGSREQQKAEAMAQAGRYIENVSEDVADAFLMARYVWQKQKTL